MLIILLGFNASSINDAATVLDLISDEDFSTAKIDIMACRIKFP